MIFTNWRSGDNAPWPKTENGSIFIATSSDYTAPEATFMLFQMYAYQKNKVL